MSDTSLITAGSDEEESLSLRGWLTLAAMMFGLFMSILDIQIVSSSLKPLSAALGASLDEIIWVQSAYIVAEVIAMPLAGWLAGALSTRYLFAASSALFTVTSLACALAWDLPSMIVFRILQGFTGGAMMPLVFSTIYILLPARQQTMGTVIVGLIAVLAPISGPIIGGWITETASWHWLFLVNLPFGILVTLLVYRLADFDEPHFDRLKHIDFLGIGLIAVFLGSLEYILKEGTTLDWLESTTIRWTVLACVAGFLLMLWREFTYSEPIIHLRGFRNRNFTIGCLLSFVTGMALVAPSYLFPVILSSIRDFNSLQIGGVLTITGMAMGLSAILAGIADKWLEPRLMAAIGFAGLGIGSLIDTGLTADVGFDQLFWGQMIRGTAMMFAFLPATALALGTLPQAEVQFASSLFNTSRTLGSAISLAAISYMMQVRFDHHYERLRASVTEGQYAVKALAAEQGGLFPLGSVIDGTDRAQLAVAEMAQALVTREALLASYNDVWFALSVTMIAALFVVGFVRPVDTQAAPVPSH